MNTQSIGERPSSHDELAAWYGAILEDQAESGLSMKHYAAQIGLSEWTLYRWRRKLTRAGDAGQAESRRLVEVEIAPRSNAVSSGLVVQVCDGRRSIAVPAGFDVDELRRLIATVESC